MFIFKILLTIVLIDGYLRLKGFRPNKPKPWQDLKYLRWFIVLTLTCLAPTYSQGMAFIGYTLLSQVLLYTRIPQRFFNKRFGL